jgi:RNA polymerase sigma-32 factor
MLNSDIKSLQFLHRGKVRDLYAIDSERRVTWLRSALTVLSDRELNILRARRLSEESATLEALGDRLGISKERVRQIESRALEKLRRALLDRHPDPDAVFV